MPLHNLSTQYTVYIHSYTCCMGCGASCWVNLYVCSMDILILHICVCVCVCVFFYSWFSLDVHKSCSSPFFPLVIFQSVYIIRCMCIYVSVWEHLFFLWKKKKNLRLRIFYVTCIPIILTHWSWCCLFNLNDIAKKNNETTNSNNQFHIQIWNSKYWALIKFETNVNIW